MSRFISDSAIPVTMREAAEAAIGCAVCGETLRADNRIGVCTRTEACRQERERRRDPQIESEGETDEPTPLRYRPGEKVRVNGLCDLRSLIDLPAVVLENFNFTVRIQFEDGRTHILRHESISAAE